jgi:glycerate kinase
MADGGEGSLNVLNEHIPLEFLRVNTVNAIGDSISVEYGIRNDEAFIESAFIIGLQLLHIDQRNPMETHSFGIGLVILDAIKNGAKIIHLFLGGSATNDGGMGIASALGFKFMSSNGQKLLPSGKNLMHIYKIETHDINKDIPNIEFKIYCDVNTQFYGAKGASFLFAKQKGAKEEEIEILDQGLKNLSRIIHKTFDSNISKIKGSGAAGGIAGGCMAFLKAQLFSGIDYFINITSLEYKINQADLIISGEGHLDDQSVSGKVVSGISKLCKKYKKPLILVVGSSKISDENLVKLNIDALFGVKLEGMSLEDAIFSTPSRLIKIGEEIGASLK